MRRRSAITRAHPKLRAALCLFFITAGAFAANPPRPRDPAPEFNLSSQSGSQVSLKSYKGSWVILFFFGDHVSAEIRLQARNLERDLATYGAFHAAVIGIGRTSPESNRRWADEIGLTFPLLSDPEGAIARAYGADGSDSSGGGGTYEVIIAPSGNVQLPRLVTSDVDGESKHLLACLQYFKDQAGDTADR